MDHEGQRDVYDERADETLRAKTHFGPYHRQARSTLSFMLFSVLLTFDIVRVVVMTSLSLSLSYVSVIVLYRKY